MNRVISSTNITLPNCEQGKKKVLHFELLWKKVSVIRKMISYENNLESNLTQE